MTCESFNDEMHDWFYTQGDDWMKHLRHIGVKPLIQGVRDTWEILQVWTKRSFRTFIPPHFSTKKQSSPMESHAFTIRVGRDSVKDVKKAKPTTNVNDGFCVNRSVCGQVQRADWDSVGIFAHRGVFCSWSWWQWLNLN